VLVDKGPPYATLPMTAREQGRTARFQGVPLRRNPYDDESVKHAWEQGWHEADEETALLNLAAVTQELLESVVERERGVIHVDPNLMHLFKHAAEDAARFV
jgi:hypothetical protein